MNLKNYPRQIQHPVIYLKMELLIKIVNDFKLQTNFAKRPSLDVSQFLSSPLNASYKQQKSYIMVFGTLAFTAQPGFCMFQVNKKKH